MGVVIALWAPVILVHHHHIHLSFVFSLYHFFSDDGGFCRFTSWTLRFGMPYSPRYLVASMVPFAVLGRLVKLLFPIDSINIFNFQHFVFVQLSYENFAIIYLVGCFHTVDNNQFRYS